MAIHGRVIYAFMDTKIYNMNDRQYNNIMKRIRELERMIGALKREVDTIRDNKDGDNASTIH